MKPIFAHDSKIIIRKMNLVPARYTVSMKWRERRRLSEVGFIVDL